MTTPKNTFAALVERITPGPWLADLHHTRESAGRTYGFVRPPNELVPPVTVLLGVEGMPQDEGRANAEFIAFCFNNAREIAEALGEREWIVAWLRSQAKNDRESGVETALIMAIACEIIANAIEAGTHKGDE